MDLYWLVDIDDFNSFVRYLTKNYSIYDKDSRMLGFRSYYGNKSLLYLSISIELDHDSKYSLSYMLYNDLSKEWFDNNNFVYKCRFYNRRNKLLRLNNISSI